MIKKFVIFALAALLLGAVARGVFSLTERIRNGTFETNVDYWTPYQYASTGQINYETSVTHGSSAGSAKVTNISSSSSTSSHGAAQCVDIPTADGSEYYTFKGWVFIPDDVPGNFQNAWVRMQFYDEDDCGTSMGDSNRHDSVDIATQGSWQEIAPVTMRAPASADSIQVRIYVRKSDNTGNPYAYYDDLTLYDSTPTAITLHSLSASAQPATWPLAALATVAALGIGAVTVRRRKG
jgi:hypothetical protein